MRQRLGIDTLLAQCVKSKPILSKIRKFDGYTVQNFALETLPGLYVCGSIYTPQSKGKHALIICPNGHFGGGRYREDQQQRMGTLARMGAICVDYDADMILFRLVFGGHRFSIVWQQIFPFNLKFLSRNQACGSCLLYTSPSPRDSTSSRMPSSA